MFDPVLDLLRTYVLGVDEAALLFELLAFLNEILLAEVDHYISPEHLGLLVAEVFLQASSHVVESTNRDVAARLAVALLIWVEGDAQVCVDVIPAFMLHCLWKVVLVRRLSNDNNVCLVWVNELLLFFSATLKELILSNQVRGDSDLGRFERSSASCCAPCASRELLLPHVLCLLNCLD